ncbi:SIMPL domain-containing protein [Thiohalobacter sp. IOR34]|uniref:SIMPL domain-containing protein n=1 Tax=Thiohalobacter sp. IOR34 TaxID=3057176 RepID=UPI0025B16793|nr:SIMPL domain-containing protein [Thiohalobacter sp. IOR34]WJW74758.1 SIMPL domain-containing protein [Thiohalobacter sp. IOR34]
MRNKALWIGLLLLVGGTVGAAQPPAREAGPYQRLRFQVAVSEAVANDRMQVRLAAEAEGEAPDAVAAEINRRMQWALDQARLQPGLELRSGNYSISPLYRKDRPPRWRGTQDLWLEGSDFERLARLLGRLQARLQVKSIRFQLAEATRQRIETRLVDEAVAAFRARAEQLQRDFGAAGYLLVEAALDTGGAGRPPAVALRAQAMAAEALPPPALAAGETRLRVGMSGVIELR